MQEGAEAAEAQAGPQDDAAKARALAEDMTPQVSRGAELGHGLLLWCESGRGNEQEQEVSVKRICGSRLGL